MTFNIGNMHANQINNVEGNQYLYGGQHGVVVTTQHARSAAADLRRALPAAALDRRDAGAARAAIDEVEAGLAGPQPDRPRVAGGLERLTRLLSAAGALAGAGATLVEPLRSLAGWLGELGMPVLALLR
jgi:hypothetical protein